jgi:hypothetical protein
VFVESYDYDTRLARGMVSEEEKDAHDKTAKEEKAETGTKSGTKTEKA